MPAILDSVTDNQLDRAQSPAVTFASV